MRRSRKRILFITLIIIAGNLILGYNVYRSNRKLLESQHWVQHSSEVVARSEKIGSQVREIENAIRAFVITNDDSFPQPIYRIKKTVFNEIAQLRSLTRDNPIQQQRLDSLVVDVNKSLDFSLHIVSIKQQYGSERSIMQLVTKSDKRLPGNIQKTISEIQKVENILLKQREQTYIERIKVFNLFSALLYSVMTLFASVLLINFWRSLHQITEKEQRAAELADANLELLFQNLEKEKRAAELIIANEELIYQNREKEKRANELGIANEELLFQNIEKEKRAAELVVANKELHFQNLEKEKRAAELVLANEELHFQNVEKEKRAAELVVANKELHFQNLEKEKRAAELVLANEELHFQNHEKEKRAAELVVANKELLRKEEQKEFARTNLNALINNTSDMMWSIDSSFKLITSNQPFDKVIGKAKTGMMNPAFYDSKLQAYRSLYERAFAGETFTETQYSPFPDDSWAEISFHPIFKGKTVVGTACHSRDISGRKSAELKMEEQNIELLKTNFELDRFVYSVSHDLRSPLTSVLGLLSLIEEDSKEPDTLEYCGLIRTSINRLDNFIKNILTYSRNNRTQIEPEKVLLQQTVTEIVTSLRNMQEAEGIEFEIEVDAQADFYTDVQRFNTVLENLIGNAIKYHKKGRTGRFIKISCVADYEALRLTIQDNGIGILPEYHDKIFGMFFRISGSISGSGIGLYIVKEIIKALEGSITVQSEKGRGTSFFINLKNLIP